MSLQVQYTAEPTAQRFHASDAFFRGIRGPYGSGKSVACVMEILQRSLRQQPNSEGVRKTRWAIIRQSYPELQTTTMKTWKEWVPESICPIKKSTPMEGKMITPLPDGTTVDMEVIFMAVPTPDDVKKLLSFELTGGWVNEAKEVPKEVVEGVTERVGRYPSKKDGGPTWDGVIADTNSMDDDHWWYDLAEEQRPQGYEFFDQPSALLYGPDGSLVPNPDAENVVNQPKGYKYWMDMAHGKNEDRVKVFILNEYGSTVEGRPVFPEFNEKLHVSDKPLQVATNRPLILGWDYGLTPACLLLQISPHGQLRVLEEFTTGIADEGMAPKQFARDIVRPAIDSRYPGLELDSWGDPGDARGSDGALARDHLKAHGIPTRPAWTNRLQPRLDSVRTFLNKMVDGEPGFILDPSVETLRKGLKSRYVFERVQVSGQEARYKDQPVKNGYSHVCDALQYACLTVERQNRRHSTPPPKVRKTQTGRAGY